LRRLLSVLLPVVVTVLSGCSALAPKTTVSVGNQVQTIPAGATYEFNIDAQHDQNSTLAVSLNGPGVLLVTPGFTATYIAPPTVPTPNSVTATFTAGSASASDTFTITPAPGPVVSIAPASFSATAGGAPVTLSISVTQDDPSDVLNANGAGGGTVGSPACGGCTFGPVTGTAGGGNYTVQFVPPGAGTNFNSLAQVRVVSNLPNSTPGVAYVMIK
jgi:hypothetical protein